MERGKTGEWRGEDMGVERGRLDSEDRTTIERTEGKTVDSRQEDERMEKRDDQREEGKTRELTLESLKSGGDTKS